MKNEEPLEQKTAKNTGFGELSQSRAAIVSAVVIILITHLLDILFIVLAGNSQTTLFPTTTQIIVGSVIDLLLGISLLRGKKWARNWMLLRAVLGMFVWGIGLMIQNDVPALIINTGVLLAIILLLTGSGSRIKVFGSVTLAIVTTIGGLIGSIFTFSMFLPTMPETPIPDSYETYTSEGFFSISYPPDWEPIMSVIQELEQEIKTYGKSLGLESHLTEMQVVFAAGKNTEDDNVLFVTVQVQPRGMWPLDTLVEADGQFAKENLQDYVEYSRVKTTIGERKAIISIYQAYDADSVLTKYAIAYVAGEKFIWTVLSGCKSQSFGSYSNTFDNIVRSLRVEY